ncbi:copper-sensing transcriptional repressor [Syntrophotalea carbinolica DSM 2380]|uniref:Copper-sensing transcriptional repressor n=1 Tax=Syntrophotalea carbinolica (strain DSM 2380 / NBRC 103641 / GraBd1) TaxID=338963 RepID=Q3A660_SYNC1|nr:metal-sensitive transcriptional regulator [Syntrophotalea carbinolica]ABA88147.1 copper-sensing transcriptional repressor [Syntrophotalea carbinolica DSM 2380]
MSLCGSDQDKERLLKRLHRIEGQVRGLGGMIENNRDCIEVLRQIASATMALKGVWVQVVGDHMRGCIKQAVLDGDNSDQLIDELTDLLQKIR